jgi:hypothetical protein
VLDGVSHLTVERRCDVYRDYPPATARATFAELEGDQRLERLVEEVCGYYERTDPMMSMLRKDLGRSSALEQGFEVIRTGVDAYVLVALGPFSPSSTQVAVARALLDDRTWASLTGSLSDPSAAKRECLALLCSVMS